MFELIVLALIAYFGWRYYQKSERRERATDDDVAAALTDTFAYLDGALIKDIRRIVREATSVEEAARNVGNQVMEYEAGELKLGLRPLNRRRWIELVAEIEEMEENISTARDYRRYEQMRPELEARLEAWEMLSEWGYPVVLPRRLRHRHVYVVGKSGSGKTTLLTVMLYQDVLLGCGAAFLTPEAESIEYDLLPYLPEDRLEDIVYFNPADEQCRYHLNPFYLREGEDLDRKVDAVFSSLSRLMRGDLTARISQILRQAIYALVETDGATLLDVPRLLDRTDDTYRRQVARGLSDERTRAFWTSQYEQFPVNAHVPILTRLAPFVRPRRIRNALCRPGPGLDVRRLMDDGKILLCNLSDGLLGETASELLGGLLVSEIQLATVGRADVPPSRRRPFYVYLDEFHSFVSSANVSYEKLLARARKYRVPLVLAHQQTGQLPASLVREILGNVSTLVVFLVGRDDAGRLAREMIRDDRPDPETVAPEELVTLEVGSAFVKVGRYAFPLVVDETLEAAERDDSMREHILAMSQRWRVSSVSGHDPGGAPETDGAPGPGVPAVEADPIPPDPFADLDDPQELY